MKKAAFFISALILSGQVASEERINRDFELMHEIPFLCTINVENNEIENGPFQVGTAKGADLTFECTDLNNVTVHVQSINGGLQRGNDTARLIHYSATLQADYLAPRDVIVDTEHMSTTEAVGTFFTGPNTTTSQGVLSVTVREPLHLMSPSPGVYEDTLRVTLKAPIEATS